MGPRHSPDVPSGGAGEHSRETEMVTAGGGYADTGGGGPRRRGGAAGGSIAGQAWASVLRGVWDEG